MPVGPCSSSGTAAGAPGSRSARTCTRSPSLTSAGALQVRTAAGWGVDDEARGLTSREALRRPSVSLATRRARAPAGRTTSPNRNRPATSATVSRLPRGVVSSTVAPAAARPMSVNGAPGGAAIGSTTSSRERASCSAATRAPRASSVKGARSQVPARTVASGRQPRPGSCTNSAASGSGARSSSVAGRVKRSPSG